jgi:hypothetical protein
MMEPGQEKKKGFLDRLPKMGRISQLVLLVCIFALLFGALLFIRGQISKSQAELDGTMSNLQKITGVQQTPQAKFEADLAQAKADAEAVKASFPNPQGVPQIMDTLLELADANDVSITGTKIATATPPGSVGPVITFTLSLQGQVPKFQNFLLGLDTKLPTSQIKLATFTISEVEGEYDTASVTVEVLSYEGSEQ